VAIPIMRERANMPSDAGSELLHDWIARAAPRDPDKPWVVAAEDGRALSYGELREAIGRFAGFLRAQGLRPNDRVVLLANNIIQSSICFAISG
jgi:acyl-CoA synthetase (AMP-forming)/AMP-acid ligase II